MGILSKISYLKGKLKQKHHKKREKHHENNENFDHEMLITGHFFMVHADLLGRSSQMLQRRLSVHVNPHNLQLVVIHQSANLLE